jgi:hypothetical protein
VVRTVKTGDLKVIAVERSENTSSSPVAKADSCGILMVAARKENFCNEFGDEFLPNGGNAKMPLLA